VKEWSFLTNHARALVCIAHDPGARLRDIATTVGITERSAYAIVTDLAGAGYVVKDKDTDGRRNRYQIQAHLPLPETIGRERTIGEVLDVLVTKPVGLAAALTGDARQNRPSDHGDPPCPSSARKDAPGAVSRTGGVNHIIRLPV
jgi:Winged helix DNA-binding domain